MIMNRGSKRTRPLRVNFVEAPSKIKVAPEHHDYVPTHTKWITKAERKRMDRETKDTIKAYKAVRNAGKPFEESDDATLRGLEKRLSTGVHLCRKSQKLHYVRGVMREQKNRRRRDGEKAEHFMSEPYLLSTSKWAAENALQMGASDALDVLNDDTVETYTCDAYEGLLVDFPKTLRVKKSADQKTGRLSPLSFSSNQKECVAKSA